MKYAVVASQFQENDSNTKHTHHVAYAEHWVVVEDGKFGSMVETFERGVGGIEQYMSFEFAVPVPKT